MRRADLALRLLAAGAPPHGARGDHRLVDRVVAVWSGWLRTAAVDVAARMRAGAAVRVANSSLKKRERLASHQASGCAPPLSPGIVTPACMSSRHERQD